MTRFLETVVVPSILTPRERMGAFWSGRGSYVGNIILLDIQSFMPLLVYTATHYYISRIT